MFFINYLKTKIVKFIKSTTKEFYTSTFSLLFGYIFKLCYKKFKNNNYSSSLLLDKFKPLLVSLFFVLMVISFIVTVVSVLNIIRKTIVRFRHSNNLIRESSSPFAVINKPIETMMIKDFKIDNRIVFSFEVYLYLNNSNVIYMEVDKIICKNCCSEILNDVKQTFFGNFVYTCAVCKSKTKLKYDRHTLIKKVELSLDSCCRQYYYTNNNTH